MKELSVLDVKKIAELSLLTLTEGETVAMVAELNAILSAFKALDDYPIPVELEHDKRSGLVLDEVASAGESVSRMRPDTTRNSTELSLRECLLSLFPKRSKDYLSVPQVLNKNGT